jgi:hypothetical protein
MKYAKSTFRSTLIFITMLLAFLGIGTSLRAATLPVHTCSELQSKINLAQFGDTIVVDATLRNCTGAIQLPYKGPGGGTDADYITIQSSAISSLPEGRRVGPSDMAYMPKLSSVNFNGFSYGPATVSTCTANSVFPACAGTTAGPHHWKLIGLEITSELNDRIDDLVVLGGDTAKWNVGELYSGYTNDPQVTALEQNQQLEIAPISGTSGHHHNGYVSAATWNMTGAQARVEVKRVASYSASTIFYIGSNSDNGYLIMEEDGQLFFKTKIAGVETYPTPIQYNSVQHRFWRFRHNTATDQITFETSADGSSWTVRHTVARQIAITSLRVELDAGTYAAEWNMGSAIFDNFQLIIP